MYLRGPCVLATARIQLLVERVEYLVQAPLAPRCHLCRATSVPCMEWERRCDCVLLTFCSDLCVGLILHGLGVAHVSI